MRNDPSDAEKNTLKPWQKKGWCIPPEQNAAFVCAMEDVLEVYERPYDTKRPQVCLDEAAKQILSEVRAPIVMEPGSLGEPGQVERVDNEYKREGTCALFMLFEPLAGKRKVFVRDRRTARDFAEVVAYLCDEMYPQADRIVLVMDNLNTHGPHSLYERYDPATARRLMEKLEWHYTPKHGSWLNMAEIELSALATQCLSERMGSRARLESEVAAWESDRNGEAVTADWRFTMDEARNRLKRLYPTILPS
jgi:DDE superfamily endonuclease